MSFQDELRKKTRTQLDVKQEEQKKEEKEIEAKRSREEKKRQFILAEASHMMQEIQWNLLQKGNEAKYVLSGNQCSVSCICALPERFLQRQILKSVYDNTWKDTLGIGEKDFSYRKEQVKFFVAFEYAEEYKIYTEELIALAEQNEIKLEFIVANNLLERAYVFPIAITGQKYELDGMYLAVKATSTYTVDDAFLERHKEAMVRLKEEKADENAEKLLENLQTWLTAAFFIILPILLFGGYEVEKLFRLLGDFGIFLHRVLLIGIPLAWVIVMLIGGRKK